MTSIPLHPAASRFIQPHSAAFASLVLTRSADAGAFMAQVPHAFVVGADGAIAWHGHSSRRQFTLALSAALRRAAGLGAEGDGGEAAADGSAEKKKAE